MKMVDMGREPGKPPSLASTESGPYYPQTFRLDEKDLKKLGLSNCKVGEEKTIHARAKVTEVSIGQSEGADAYESVTLTVQEMAVDGSEKDFAESFYKKMG